MEDLMFGIATNCLTAAVILWETTDLQWFPDDAGNYRSGSVSDRGAGAGKKK